MILHPRSRYCPASPLTAWLLVAAVTAAGLLGGCAAATRPAADVAAVPADAAVPPPPDVGALADSPATAADAERTGADETSRQPQIELFPGLRDDAGADNDTLPFEESLAKRRKRIDLGLETPRQENAPVNNVLEIEF